MNTPPAARPGLAVLLIAVGLTACGGTQSRSPSGPAAGTPAAVASVASGAAVPSTVAAARRTACTLLAQGTSVDAVVKALRQQGMSATDAASVVDLAVVGGTAGCASPPTDVVTAPTG